jgi:hypothetical protein
MRFVALVLHDLLHQGFHCLSNVLVINEMCEYENLKMLLHSERSLGPVEKEL